MRAWAWAATASASVAPVVVQAEQGADAEAAHAGLGAAVGRGQAPVVVALLALEVHGGVRGAVVGLLVDDEAVAPGLDQAAVGVGVPHLHLDRERRHLGRQHPHALDEVVLAHDAGVLAGDQQEVAEAAGGQRPRLVEHLGGRERAPGDLVAGREPAVGARRDALVGEVERCEQVDGAAEAAQGGAVRRLRHVLQPGGAGGRQQGGEVGQCGAAGGESPGSTSAGPARSTRRRPSRSVASRSAAALFAGTPSGRDSRTTG